MKTKLGITGLVAGLALFTAACGSSSGSSTATDSAMNEYEVTVTNNTSGQPVTPPLVIAHNNDFSLFTPGTAASTGLTLQAEDGDPSVAKEEAVAGGAVATATGDGIILPGESATVTIQFAGDASMITVTAMLATTNDAFAAIRGVALPATGSTTYDATVYDAGTEMNTESCAHIPGPPCGNGGVRAGGGEGSIQTHGGIVGIADLSVAQYGWSDPAVTVKVTKK